MNLLIVRFSSFGDIVQAMAILRPWKERYPNAKITWVTKQAFAGLVALSPFVDKVISLGKSANPSQGSANSLSQLVALFKNDQFDFIYDAHNVTRSKFLLAKMRMAGVKGKRLTRPKNRWKRFLLFQLRINLFPQPFKGMQSFLQPLQDEGLIPTQLSNSTLVQNWNFPSTCLKKIESLTSGFNLREAVVFCPSAAWAMKRWPIEHWIALAHRVQSPIILLGGPEDTFCEVIRQVAPERIVNLAGKLSLEESCAVIAHVNYTISADTGLIHVADLLGKKGSVLIGPTAFGFTTSPLITTLEVDLPCRPCSKDGRGKCTRSIYQECMVNISPDKVEQVLKEGLK
jgi:ADP-heptose:LPS heptosyltransferase